MSGLQRRRFELTLRRAAPPHPRHSRFGRDGGGWNPRLYPSSRLETLRADDDDHLVDHCHGMCLLYFPSEPYNSCRVQAIELGSRKSCGEWAQSAIDPQLSYSYPKSLERLRAPRTKMSREEEYNQIYHLSTELELNTLS